jgi:aldose 1-epimerase
VKLFALRNDHGLEVRATDFGGIILSIMAPDRDGRLDDVVLGHDSPADYARNPAYLGAIIGRFANRIAHGRFNLDGETHTLSINHGAHHLHGGSRGFDRVTWDAVRSFDHDGDHLTLRHTSPDGDQGYPGTVRARVRYTLTHDDRLIVDYHATTDRATPINLTQHSYFNLAGDRAARADRADHILDHVLTIPAHRFTPIDDETLPTGEIRDVDATPLDFRTPTPLGARIHDDHPQLRLSGGYDHNFVMADGPRPEPSPAAHLHHPATGRMLTVHTTEPGLQLYTGNGFDGSIVGRGGVRYGPHAGLALETQHWPDAPNRPHFPTTILRPGAEYRSRTIYTFSVRDD